MTKLKGKKRIMDDPAKRNETNNERPNQKEVRTSQKERNDPWANQPKGKKRKMDYLAKRNEKNNG